ncbi:hypothetical protein, partial [Escherichia coli]|uniref:hypothetical protein n=1 Tax=Escherichia coli TaxID=562 RepID=UPI001FCF1E70
LVVVTGLYAGNLRSVTGARLISSIYSFPSGHKNASRGEAPARMSQGVQGLSRPAGCQVAGISTVSTTWMTPFDWLTLGIVTIEV